MITIRPAKERMRTEVGGDGAAVTDEAVVELEATALADVLLFDLA